MTNLSISTTINTKIWRKWQEGRSAININFNREVIIGKSQNAVNNKCVVKIVYYLHIKFSSIIPSIFLQYLNHNWMLMYVSIQYTIHVLFSFIVKIKCMCGSLIFSEKNCFSNFLITHLCQSVLQASNRSKCTLKLYTFYFLIAF